MKQGIINDPTFSQIHLANSSQKIACTIISTVINELQRQAPEYKVQLRPKTPIFVSHRTKELIQLRDELLGKAKTTQSTEDNIHYKNVRNLVHKKMTEDKISHYRTKLDEMDTDPKSMWTQSKELIGWTKSSSP